jgi:hypothetical protein
MSGMDLEAARTIGTVASATAAWAALGISLYTLRRASKKLRLGVIALIEPDYDNGDDTLFLYVQVHNLGRPIEVSRIGMRAAHLDPCMLAKPFSEDISVRIEEDHKRWFTLGLPEPDHNYIGVTVFTRCGHMVDCKLSPLLKADKSGTAAGVQKAG